MTRIIGNVHDLKTIYRQALARCAPERLVRACISSDAPREVVAIGKCAAGLLEGVATTVPIERAFVALPAGYREPRADMAGGFQMQVARGGHPQMDDSSFAAGRELLRFVDSCDEVLFLISGGGSACVEVPLAPWFDEHDLAATNRRLIASGLPIGEINTVRKHLSAIKGGRLASRVHGRTMTLIYSDVATGAQADVASGPTMPDHSSAHDAIRILERLGGCEAIVSALLHESLPPTISQIENMKVQLVADNGTLTEAAEAAATELGFQTVRITEQIEDEVEVAASKLAAAASKLRAGEMLIAGGEPTVVQHGHGKGGRCSELALRFARAARGQSNITALFASSDGVDGNSGSAGIFLGALPRQLDLQEIEAALAASDSFPLAARHGEAIIIPATGNNLRDLVLVTRS